MPLESLKGLFIFLAPSVWLGCEKAHTWYPHTWDAYQNVFWGIFLSISIEIYSLKLCVKIKKIHFPFLSYIFQKLVANNLIFTQKGRFHSSPLQYLGYIFFPRLSGQHLGESSASPTLVTTPFKSSPFHHAISQSVYSGHGKSAKGKPKGLCSLQGEGLAIWNGQQLLRTLQWRWQNWQQEWPR